MSLYNSEMHRKVVQARADLVIEQPFFAALALRLKVKEDPGCRTAWTDGQVFAYNPSYVGVLSRDKVKGLCSHTVMHAACEHHMRRRGRDAALWNRACDYAINPILLDAGVTLPDGFLYDADFRGKSADAVYDLLSQGDPESSDVSKSDSAQDLKKNDEQNSGTAQGTEDLKPALKADKDTADETLIDPGLSGEIRDGDGRDAAGHDEDSSIDWEEAVIQAAGSARQMGKLPRGIERFFKSLAVPKLSWQQILERFIQRNISSDYSWVMPNRRFIHQDLYFPSLNTYQLNEIAVAIDTSGSIREMLLP